MENKQKVKFNNKEYEWNKLSQKAKLYFGQLRDIDNKILQLKMQVDQLNMARQGFTSTLQNELESKSSPSVKVNYVPKAKTNEKDVN